ncbi:cytidylyltransferase domain-containing protein [Winogradskyella sediminis]|uniref:acylneuraminate cytidylyltransferase family protein n=1 Tax=Winogradskyella sediminis TaxID=1382466 RepID=UPI003AA93A70
MDNLVKYNITAIIPARGGSKRIPHKNIIPIGGKPMIAWTIEAALNSKYISKVIVSTDNEDIAAVSQTYGADVPFLRKENADDNSPISLATISTLKQMKASGIKTPDIIVQLMANCPLRETEQIDEAIANFIDTPTEFQISSFKYGWMNPWWAHTVDKDNLAKPLFSEEQRMKRSQDLEDLYCPTGAIWIAKTIPLLESQTFYGEDYKFFPMNWINAIDIDDYEDLEMAKFYIDKRIGS